MPLSTSQTVPRWVSDLVEFKAASHQNQPGLPATSVWRALSQCERPEHRDRYDDVRARPSQRSSRTGRSGPQLLGDLPQERCIEMDDPIVGAGRPPTRTGTRTVRRVRWFAQRPIAGSLCVSPRPLPGGRVHLQPSERGVQASDRVLQRISVANWRMRARHCRSSAKPRWACSGHWVHCYELLLEALALPLSATRSRGPSTTGQSSSLVASKRSSAGSQRRSSAACFTPMGAGYSTG